ncbi:unnamed protein product, partial [Enterobius vermicularis]|uniref:Post-GPI attachment to proteins factor 3 n=1 Tax=Enterobius vermicularis TaxID=51028 RepID=A0A0N4V040_ENTVE
NYGDFFNQYCSCRQNCIWKTLDNHLASVEDGSVLQFYGKWPFLSYSLPFLSFIPMQEPASVIFSVLNLFTTLYLYKGACQFFMRNVWRTYAGIGIFAWLSSTAFHWSDFWLTEYLDYFSAYAVIMFAFFTSVSLVIVPLHRLRFITLWYLFDFPPLMWVFDSHSLFHLATVPVPLFLLRFIQLENNSDLVNSREYAKMA